MEQVKIGNFIAERRKLLSLTQKELADKLYISDKTVSKWERGHELPEASLMLPLCESLNITVNELLAGKRFPTHNAGVRQESAHHHPTQAHLPRV